MNDCSMYVYMYVRMCVYVYTYMSMYVCMYDVYMYVRIRVVKHLRYGGRAALKWK
jgi:hypothetical protein